MCVNTLPRAGAPLVALSTTERFYATHGWIPCSGVGDVGFQLFLWNLAGAFQARPAIQFAEARTESPGAAAGVGTAVTASGAHRFSTTPSTGPQFYMRFGVMYALTSGSTEAYADVALLATFKDCGRTLPLRTIAINPGDTGTSQEAIFPVTDLVPTVGISKAKLAITIERNANANLEYIEMCRIFKVEGVPGSWAAMEGVGWTNPASGNSDRNTGEMSFPTGVGVANQFYVQLGLGIRQASASLLRSRLRVQPAVIY